MEQTFFIIKPDGVKRGLIGQVLKRIEERGFKIEKLELRSTVSEALIDQHYQDLVEKSFYPPIRQFMTSGPVVVGILSGPKVIETWRTMMGATRPEEALPGTIRGDFAKAAGDNQAIHADALTMAFATLGLIQLFHAYNVKSVYQSILTVGPFKSKTFNWSILVSFILLMATIVVEPLEGIFHVTKLDLSQWGIVLAGSFSMILIVEIVKFVQRKLGLDKNAI